MLQPTMTTEASAQKGQKEKLGKGAAHREVARTYEDPGAKRNRAYRRNWGRGREMADVREAAQRRVMGRGVSGRQKGSLEV